MTSPSPRSLAAAVLVALALPAGAAAADRTYVPSATPDRVVLNPTADPERSQTFSWRTDRATAPGAVEVVQEDGIGTYVQPATTTAQRAEGPEGGRDYEVRHQTATVTGLEPGTRYRYRVGGAAGWSPWRSFTTATADARSPWRFLVFGDAQNGLHDRWPANVGRAYATVPDPRLVLHAGDLINHPTYDVEWGDWFAAQGEIPATVNQLSTAGNHEYLYDLGSIDTSASRFRAHFRHPANGPLGDDNLAYVTDYQGVRFISLSTGLGLDLIALARQRAWLQRMLADNPSRWTVVMFHYPVYSTGAGRGNPQVRSAFGDVLERHDVDLVLQGHDHTYGRGHRTPDGPQYVVSVLGPKYYDLTPEGDNDWTRNGATRVAAAGQTSTFQAVCVSQDRLVYESVIAAKGEASTTTRAIGETLDAFTVDRSGPRKRVVEGGTCAKQEPAPGGGGEPGGSEPGGGEPVTPSPEPGTPAGEPEAPTGAPAPATPSPAPASPTGTASSRTRAPHADATLLRCVRAGVLVTDIRRAGRGREVVAGVADPARAGATAVLAYGRRTVARTTVGADGAFAFRVEAPAGAGRYRATVAGRSSAWVKRTRRMTRPAVTRSAGVLTVRGRVTGPRRAGGRVTVAVRRGCGRWTAGARARLAADGRWSATVRVPAGTAVSVRAQATLPGVRGRGVRTFSLPRAVR